MNARQKVHYSHHSWVLVIALCLSFSTACSDDEAEQPPGDVAVAEDTGIIDDDTGDTAPLDASTDAESGEDTDTADDAGSGEEDAFDASDDADAAGDAGSADTGVDAASDTGDTADAGGEFEPSQGMAYVPAGTYRRGCDDQIDDDCSILGHEEPPHEVFVSAFEIDIQVVTEAEYGACVANGPCDESHGDQRGDNYPVVDVTSDQAQTYCEWVDKRLPTEAEWEKAARGDDERLYPWGDDEPDCSRANYDDCGGEIEPVGERPAGASPYGVEDMAGNVRNWALDWFQGDYYAESPDEDPMGPESGDTRAVRGGSWFHGESMLRVSSRHGMENPGHGPETGFRCARSVEP